MDGVGVASSTSAATMYFNPDVSGQKRISDVAGFAVAVGPAGRMLHPGAAAGWAGNSTASCSIAILQRKFHQLVTQSLSVLVAISCGVHAGHRLRGHRSVSNALRIKQVMPSRPPPAMPPPGFRPLLAERATGQTAPHSSSPGRGDRTRVYSFCVPTWPGPAGRKISHIPAPTMRIPPTTT